MNQEFECPDYKPHQKNKEVLVNLNLVSLDNWCPYGTLATTEVVYRLSWRGS